ncbi:Planctomycete cytochrome C [compost metagenome]
MEIAGLFSQNAGNLDLASAAASLNPDLQEAALKIISQNCSGCHGATSGSANIYGLTDVNHLITSGLIVPGQPNQSYLLRVIQNGVMPPNGPLSAADQETLRLWVLGGTPSSGNGGNTGTNPPTTPTPAPTPLPPSDVQGRALRVLAQNCTACHGETSGSGGVFGLQNVSHLVSAGLIIPGNPDQSRIYTVIRSGVMPPNGPLSQADQDLIRQWIQGEVSTGAPPPTAPTPEATFKYISSEILTPKCVACHSATKASGGYRFDTYTGVLKAVSKTRPTDSDIYKVVEDGEMPPRPGTPLSSAQQQVILEWIQKGALNN